MVYGTIYLVLVVGAVSMIYPFLLMLAGSTKSEADIVNIAPYPQFWFDDLVLFQKYVESKYSVSLVAAERAWGRPVRNWRRIERPEPSDLLEEFLAWRQTDRCRWWDLGHTGDVNEKMLPENAREFRRLMYDRFAGDLEAFRREMNMPAKSWSGVRPPRPNPMRYPRRHEGFMGAFQDFAATRPLRDRIIGNPDGEFWNRHLVPKYTDDIAAYNLQHGTSYASYDEVLLTRRVPDNPLQRQDWEEFVREVMQLRYVRLSPALAPRFRTFLATKKYEDIGGYNRAHAAALTSFDDVPFPTSLPETRAEQVDWQEFILDAEACPAEDIEIYGPRQSFEEFLTERRGAALESVVPALLPIAQADWHDCMTDARDLRWEFTTRNYKHVLDYILLHGRGIQNTVIYCLLAIGLALIVNPLAAYALSRYKPPTTYTVLLFCMATMAFPNEVTMIPAFLLLKRFPLWSLLAGVATFLVFVWLLGRLLKRTPELLRLTLALGAAIVVGAWLVPSMVAAPHVSLLNTFAALVLPHMANGYMIFLLKGFFDSLPQELYEAADLDGASEWTKFWSFTMALSKPILAVLALRAFTMAYTQFMMALIIIPNPKMWTLMVWLFQLQSESHQSVVYASLVIAALPTLLVFIFCQRIIIRGIVVPTEK